MIGRCGSRYWMEGGVLMSVPQSAVRLDGLDSDPLERLHNVRKTFRHSAHPALAVSDFSTFPVP